MTLLEVSAYFEEIAQRHISIQHKPDIESKQTYFCLNTDKNADDFIRSREMETIIILLPPDKKLYPPSAENYNWDKHIAFMVLNRCPDTTAANITQAQNLTEVIADDFVCQMLEDRDVLLHGLQEESFVMEPVGPVADCHYGYICMFTLIDQFNQYRNPARLPSR